MRVLRERRETRENMEAKEKLPEEEEKNNKAETTKHEEKLKIRDKGGRWKSISTHCLLPGLRTRSGESRLLNGLEEAMERLSVGQR